MSHSKMSFGKSTEQQAAIMRNSDSAKAKSGGNKGPAAPPMNKNKGHMSSRHGKHDLLDSREVETLLRGKDWSSSAVQIWKTQHNADVVELVHPTSTVDVPRPPELDSEGHEVIELDAPVDYVPAKVFVPASDTILYLDKGFTHVPLPPEADDGTAEAAAAGSAEGAAAAVVDDDPDTYTQQELDALTKAEVEQIAAEGGLSISGTKAEIVARILDAQAAGG